MELRSSGLLARCHSVRRLQVTTGPVHVQGKEGRNVRYRKVKGGEGRDTSCTIEAFGIKEVATSQGRRTAPENGRCTAWRMLRRNVTDDILPIDSTCASTASVGYDICASNEINDAQISGIKAYMSSSVVLVAARS